MSVADLTGTTWLINSSYSDPSSTIWKSINFTSNSMSFNAITIYDDMDNEQTIAYRGAEEYPTIVYSWGWTNEAYRTIVITGGTDATDAILIAWLEANASNVTPASPDVVISYNNAEIATMSASGTKTLETEGTFCTDDITVVYTKPSAPTPTLQAKTNIAPTTSSQTITADAGYDGLSSVQINAMPTGTAGTPSATKGTVSNHAVSVTPSVTNTTGYITGGTKTGTAVSVAASELVSGTKSITENGTGIDVTNYASVDVNVSGGGGGGGTEYTIPISNHQIMGNSGFDLTSVNLTANDLVLDGNTLFWIEFTQSTSFTCWLDPDDDNDFTVTLPSGTKLTCADVTVRDYSNDLYFVGHTSSTYGFLLVNVDKSDDFGAFMAWGDNPSNGSFVRSIAFKAQNGSPNVANSSPQGLVLHIIKFS